MESYRRVTVTRLEVNTIDLRISDMIGILRERGHEIPATPDVTITVEGREFPIYQHNPIEIKWTVKSEQEER